MHEKGVLCIENDRRQKIDMKSGLEKKNSKYLGCLRILCYFCKAINGKEMTSIISAMNSNRLATSLSLSLSQR